MHTPPCDQQTITGAAQAFTELLEDFLIDVQGINLADKTERNLIINYADDLAGYLIELNDFEDTQIAETLNGEVAA